MAFVLPTFNTTCNIWHLSINVAAPPDEVDIPCQLRAPSASYIGLLQPSASQVVCMCILLPPLTDIRDLNIGGGTSTDTVEVPAGTGRYYRVSNVDDIAKGFPNEHRFAILFKVLALPWPTPIP